MIRWFGGIDPGSEKHGFAVLEVDVDYTDLEHPKARSMEIVDRGHTTDPELMSNSELALAKEGRGPLEVTDYWVEMPYYQGPQRSTGYVFQTAIWSGWFWGKGAKPVGSGDWRICLLGKNNASDAQAQALVARLGIKVPKSGETKQHVVDAICVAIYGMVEQGIDISGVGT